MTSPRALRTLKLAIIVILASATILLVWFHLPFQIQRRTEIQTGEILAQKLNTYYRSTNKSPDTGDWKTLEKIGFKLTDLGTQPDYKKISDTSYELIFMKGFDGPYLTYHSVTKKWAVE